MHKLRKTIALVGNPNVGKSTLFNKLTGMHQHTGNWSGKTVSLARGGFSTDTTRFELIDLPGTYSLLPHSAEEKVTRDFLFKERPDMVMVVCDATCLERNLLLALQVQSICSHVLLCVNLMDEAAKKGIHIDLQRLEKQLGIPVIGTAARKRNGLKSLRKYLQHFPSDDNISACAKSQLQQTLDSAAGFSEEDTLLFSELAARLSLEVISYDNIHYQKKDRALDSILTGKYTAYPVMLLLLALIFWLTIVGANCPSALLSSLFHRGEEGLYSLFSALQAPFWLTDLMLAGVYRVLTWIVSVMLPPMAIFFPLFTLLEDVGYLPRIAYNLDCPLKKCCACGKQALTMTMGFGCNAVGVTGCRIIASPRERLLAILTNSFVPCNGRFPTLITLITLFFIGSEEGLTGSLCAALFLTGFILFGISMTFAVSKLLSATVLKGLPSFFSLELPPYRRPKIGNVLVRSVLDRTVFVLGRAVTVALPAGIVIWAMANIPVGSGSLLGFTAGILDPFARLLGLDGVILLAFLLGMPANEIVLPIILMAYSATGSLTEIENLGFFKELLIENGWSMRTALCTCLFSLMHWPCATTLLTIKKETGSLKWTLLSFFLPTACGILVCMLVRALVPA